MLKDLAKKLVAATAFLMMLLLRVSLFRFSQQHAARPPVSAPKPTPASASMPARPRLPAARVAECHQVLFSPWVGVCRPVCVAGTRERRQVGDEPSITTTV